jgi:DnaJ-class molecular chaperone
MRRIPFTHPCLYTEEAGAITLQLPATRIVCPTCEGYGNHFRRDLDENALVREMMLEHDREGLEMYRAGYFNQKCEQCRGEKVLDDIDWKYFKEEYPEHYKAVNDYKNRMWEDEANRAWERSMGA